MPFLVFQPFHRRPDTRSRSAARLGAMLAALVAVGPAGAAVYTDVSAQVGITHRQSELVGPGQYLPGALIMSGGVAAADVDNDGWTDLYFTRVGMPDKLYRNNGDGTFSDVSAPSGFTANNQTNGAAFADLDRDGDQDLYVTGTGDLRNYLYINDGSGVFTEQAIARGAETNLPYPYTYRFGQSVGLGDYDNDGHVDIMTSDWGNSTNFSQARLLRNNANAQPGHFADRTSFAGLNQYRTDTSFRFTPVFSDVDRDGRQDLVMTSDFLTGQLFWNDGDNTFTDGTIPANVGTDQNGMGTTVGDIDNDGDLDIFITAIKAVPGAVNPIQDTGNRLYLNNGDLTFTDATDAWGVRDAGWGWGTQFLDFDNDGDLDLIATNGWGDDHEHDPTTLWRNDGGHMTNITGPAISGITDNLQGRGLIHLDYDKDGDLDVIVANQVDEPVIYRNDTGELENPNAYLRLDLEGVTSNLDGIGAFVTLTPDLDQPENFQVRVMDGASSYLSMSERMIHFGLGQFTGTIDKITIDWLGPGFDTLYDVPINTTLLVREGVGIVAVPEPATLAMVLTVGGLGLAHRRRFRPTPAR